MSLAASYAEPFARFVRERLFVPAEAARRRIGAEVELIPLLAEGGAMSPLEARIGVEGPSTLGFLRRFGAARGWREQRSPKGAPYFALPGGSTLTFEPGGQVELGSPPCETASELIAALHRELEPMIAAAADHGIVMLSLGIDPANGLSAVPLQLEAERYRRMDAYFNQLGPSGARMMRQTAATQLNLDAGADPAARWRLLCDLAPYLTAIFANSARYAGAESGQRSFRAHCWRTLDATRTGNPSGDAPACEAYTRFALDAVDMMRQDESNAYRPYGAWASEGASTIERWETHLSTLFPEVRPRGHLELRSMDAIAPRWLAAPIVVVCGLVYDRDSAGAAREVLGSADEDTLSLAARCGLRAPSIGTTAADLFALGIEGARRLGESYVSPSDLDVALAFYEEYTRLGLSPADDR